MLLKAEQDSPFWCQTCGFATPTCGHRVVYQSGRGKPGWADLTEEAQRGAFQPRILRSHDQHRQQFPDSGAAGAMGNAGVNSQVTGFTGVTPPNIP